MKFTQEYQGWILHWEQDTYSRIYIVYDSKQNILHHYNNETKTEWIDCYHESSCEEHDTFYTRHNESKNTNYRTQNIFITRILS